MSRCLGIFAAVLLAGVAIVGCRREPPPPPRVEINGRVWTVEPVTTNEERIRGLGGREHLGDDEGMLFIYPDARHRAFCMRDCLIPLDIAFIGSDLTVVRTDTMAVEPDRKGRRWYPSGAPAQYVLEVRAGALEAAGVKAGDRVTFHGDVPDAAKAEDGP